MARQSSEPSTRRRRRRLACWRVPGRNWWPMKRCLNHSVKVYTITAGLGMFHQLIPFATYGDEELWLCGIRLNLATEFGHMDIDSASLNARGFRIPPDFCEQFFQGDRTVVVLHEILQNLNLAAREEDGVGPLRLGANEIPGVDLQPFPNPQLCLLLPPFGGAA